MKLIGQLFPHCYSVGTYTRIQEVEELIFNAFQNSNVAINDFILWKYCRLLKDEKLYVSKMYARALQTESSVVQFRHGVLCRLGFVHCFIKMFRCECHENECICRHYAIIQEVVPYSVLVAEGDNNVRCQTTKFLRKCHVTNEFFAIPTENLLKVCVFMKLGGCSYVALPVDDKELE